MSLLINNVSFGYSKEKKILSNITFSAESGQVLSLLGPNGTGKTTLLKCINHILVPSEGSIAINDLDVASMKPKKRAELIGYVPQYNNTVFPINVVDTIMLGRIPFVGRNFTSNDKEIVFDIIEKMALSDFAFKYTNEMSGGERQRVYIARALVSEPQFIVLDEPTSSLDLKNQLSILELVSNLAKDKNIGVVLSIHDLNLASMFSDKIVMIKDGRVFSVGNSKEVITEKNIKNVYGVKTEVSLKDNYNHVRLIK